MNGLFPVYLNIESIYWLLVKIWINVQFALFLESEVHLMVALHNGQDGWPDRDSVANV